MSVSIFLAAIIYPKPRGPESPRHPGPCLDPARVIYRCLCLCSYGEQGRTFACVDPHSAGDRVTPICGRCRNARRDCRRTGIRIRETKRPSVRAKYSKTQKWVKTPRRLVFISETDFGDDGASPDGEQDGYEVEFESSPPASEELVRRPSLRSPKIEPLSPTVTDRRVGIAQHTGPQLILDKPIWPLSKQEEAELLRHYVQKLAIWLDLCDPKQSFGTVVPQLAGSCPILLNAILALAGRHMSHTNPRFDRDAYLKYSDRCIKLLIEASHHRSTVLKEEVFAATIIMRVLAEIEGRQCSTKDEGSFNDHHLRGIHAFVRHQQSTMRPDSLGAAAFWVGLRQEIYSAVTTTKKVDMTLVPSLVDQSLSPADDYTWANRAVVHCTHVLNFCYGTTKEKAKWDELSRWNQNWLRSLPPSYTPVFRQSGNDPFPAIWYNRSCHVIGKQHHLLAQLFLAENGPQRPNSVQDRMNLREQQQLLVREICGIGLGNTWTPPGMFTACMAIEAFGDVFSDHRDREAMLDILKRTEREHARPTETVQNSLKQVWRWTSSLEREMLPAR
ncbi:hypothetical protein B0H66DRAFT_472452 [Apodospora peruviana]|uniref:Zn(2)-C6 fungal-type domain-containing protein n=1 Tax=Apodospora peruviana TaxID=516989 RepID=A0AAE0IH84_9PEZI|nr:hypothetical protein B0H66DRAFT_472452 [Apodospora peruviana]